MSSSISSRQSDVVSMLLVDASKSDHATIAGHIGAYPIALLQRLVASRCRVRHCVRRSGIAMHHRRCGG